MFLMLAASAHAQQPKHTINDLLEFAAVDDRFQGLITGAGRGIEGVRIHYIRNNITPLYCQPQNLSITGDQYKNILSGYISKNPNYGDLDMNAYGWVLLQALIDTFPCR